MQCLCFGGRPLFYEIFYRVFKKVILRYTVVIIAKINYHFGMLNIYNSNNHNEEKINDVSSGKVLPKSSFTKYEDPTKEFSSSELKWGFWLLHNKALVYKIVVITLIVINLAFIIFSIWKWAVFLLGYTDQQKLERSLTASINYTGIQPHFAAQPVQVVSTHVFSSGNNKYDLVAELVNPNSNFLIQFDYYFVVSGIKTKMQKTFLLPGESRLAASLGVGDVGSESPVIVLENIQYKRISNHAIASPIDYQRYRLNFQVTDFVFSKSLAQEGNNADAVQFKLTNNSPYNYILPNFYVALLQNGQLVGVLPLQLDRINSLEVKDVDLRSFAQNLNISEIAIYPIINVYDDSVYIP